MQPTDAAATMDYRVFVGPLKVSLSYIGMYYMFIIGQVVSTYYIYNREKKNSKEKVSLLQIRYNSNDPLKLTADRAVGNTLEQMIPFLSGLWICAVFVSPSEAANLGWIYVATRAIYPPLFYLNGAWRLIATVPNYIVIGMLWFKVYSLLNNQ